MKKELKQLNRAQGWLMMAIRARQLVKSNVWNANNLPEDDFPNMHRRHMKAAERCEKIQLYCYARYLKALESLNELTPLIR